MLCHLQHHAALEQHADNIHKQLHAALRQHRADQVSNSSAMVLAGGEDQRKVWTVGWCGTPMSTKVCIQGSCFSFPPPDTSKLKSKDDEEAFGAGISVFSYIRSGIGSMRKATAPCITADQTVCMTVKKALVPMFDLKLTLGASLGVCGSAIDAMATFSLYVGLNVCVAIPGVKQVMQLICLGNNCFSAGKLSYYPFIGKLTLTDTVGLDPHEYYRVKLEMNWVVHDLTNPVHWHCTNKGYSEWWSWQYIYQNTWHGRSHSAICNDWRYRKAHQCWDASHDVKQDCLEDFREA